MTTSVQTTGATAIDTAAPWWAAAVIYQIYPRSFADANADGMGDLAGVTERLPYLSTLGVDAVWLSPFYVSPQADAGYDVADYRNVDPLFGTLADFDTMLAAAHARGIRVIVDLVPNHTSDEHAWFQKALAASPGSAARDRYIFRDGCGERGEQPPNNWQSVFGGPAWTRLKSSPTDDDAGSPAGAQWYLHLFDTKQPDLNWDNPEVQAEMVSVLKFWLDRGVDGFRIDVAHGLIKAEGLPDWSGRAAMVAGDGTAEAANLPPEEELSAREGNPPPPEEEQSPMFDQDGVHEIYREWNKVLQEYSGDRMLVAEAWVEPASRLARYVREDEMHQAFNFDFLLAGWDAPQMAVSIVESLKAASSVGAPSTWVLSNHDTVRHPTRFGLKDPTTFPKGISGDDEQPDEALGLSRGRAGTMIMLALPGSAYIYQGEELGVPEHTTLAAEVRQDPSFFRTGGKESGRDGARVPLPWVADAPGYGFGDHAAGNGKPKAEPGAEPWLPQPDSFAAYAADQQIGAAGSTYELYRSLLELRGQYRLGTGRLIWSKFNAPDDGILSFSNGELLVLANMGTETAPLPAGYVVLIASEVEAAANGQLRANAAVWLVRV